MACNKKNVFTAAIFLTLQLIVVSAIANPVNDSPAAIADELHTALSEGNAEKVNELLAPDVLIFESGGVEQSREEYASHHMHSDMEFMANIQRELLSRQVFENDGIAVVSSHSGLTGTFREKEVNILSTETLVFSETEDGWRVSHIHWSSRSKD